MRGRGRGRVRGRVREAKEAILQVKLEALCSLEGSLFLCACVGATRPTVEKRLVN